MRSVVVVGVLVILAACGGEEFAVPRAVPLSPDGARHTYHTYSPDGKQITYWAPATDSTTNTELWLANADLSAPRRLPAALGGGPMAAIWSPDGSRVATGTNSSTGLAQVVIISVPGGEVQRVTQDAGPRVPVVWYRHGEALSYYGPSGRGEIKSFVVDLRTGVRGPLNPGEKRSHLGTPSPDGSHMAYFLPEGAKSTIWVADGDGRNARQLTSEGFEYTVFQQEWSPDGKEVLYVSNRTGKADLWIAPIDGRKPRQLTRDVRDDRDAVWSNDGKWIAFISNRGRQTDVWVMPSAGGEERRVTDSAEEEERPVWRPGTNELTFVVKSERSGIWALDLASGAERRLTPDSIRARFFQISPDGNKLLFVIDRGGGIQDLAVMPVAGGAMRVLVAGGGNVDPPYWWPDGSKIVFTSNRAGSIDVWVVDTTGGAPRPLVAWPGLEGAIGFIGDGSAMLFMSDSGGGGFGGSIWKLPTTGGNATQLTPRGGFAFAGLSRSGVADVFGGHMNSRGGQFAIARIRPDGRMNTVWDRTSAFLASISPSGDSVAAIVQPPGVPGSQSMILSASGGGGRVILKQGERVGSWSSDGQFVLYTFGVAGATDLGMLRLADGTTRRLTNTPEDESTEEAGAEFTPNGKTVVFRRSQTVERLFTVDVSKLLTGGKP